MAKRLAMLCLCLLLTVSYALADEPVYAINVGGQDYVDSQGIHFSQDTAYAASGGGYEGGSVQSPPYVLYSAAWSSVDPALHETQRSNMAAYRFDLPAGDYLLRLYWLEGQMHGPRLRLMDVRIEGALLFNALDLGARPGYMCAWELSRLVSVSDGTLDIEFEALRGGTTLSAVAIWDAVDGGQDPDPVAGFSLRDSYGMNILRWDGSFDYTLQDVLIYRSQSPGGPFELHDSVPYNQERYYDWDAIGGQTYYYRLGATDVWGRESQPTGVEGSMALHWSDSSLPVFRLDMTQADYDSLNSHPFSDAYWPANWAVDSGLLYSIEARYRGGMARFFRKKSWKLELPGLLEYNGWQDLFLISNPDDIYVIRNDVSLRIFDYLGPWSSDSEFIHLEFEGEYWGVYELVEKVDDEFLERRGITDIGNLYKANADFRAYPSASVYEAYYPKKAGPDDSYADLIYFIEGVDQADAFDLPPFLASQLDVDNFLDYYAMMIYTRQVDFIVRNYYLYRDWDTGLWSLIPWDMNICFYWTELPLDFGTEDSPHFWDGSWNRLYDAVLRVPRLRWDYAKRLQALNATVLNQDYLAPLVYGIFGDIEFDALRDVHKPFYDDNELFEQAADLVSFRMGQRDDQLVTMLPEFMSEIPTVCINEYQTVPGGPAEAQDRNEFSSWLELYNFGDVPAFLGDLELTVDGQPGSGCSLPPLFLKPGDPLIVYLDGRPELGALHLPIAPDPEGGTWVILDETGKSWDAVRYAAAAANRSEGRQPDGWINWQAMPPTPQRANSLLQPPVISSATLAPDHPLASDTLDIQVEAVDPTGRPLELTFFWTLRESEVKSRRLMPGETEGQWTGMLAPRMQGGLLKWWVRASNDLELATYDPPAAPFYYHECLILDDNLPLYLNEFMADNLTTIADEHGGYDDWLEIYNAGETAVDLAGFTLTDELSVPGAWIFPEDPACVIEAGAFLLVWADDETWQGPLHSNFKLAKTGEELALFMPDGTPVDFLSFGQQQEDVSYGRVTDGGEPWDFLLVPSPGASNEGEPPAAEDTDPASPSLGAWPNPFNPQVRLRLVNPAPGPVRLEIFDVTGRRVRRLIAGELPAGARDFVWSGRDDESRLLASGLYFARLEAGGEVLTQKILLLK